MILVKIKLLGAVLCVSSQLRRVETGVELFTRAKLKNIRAEIFEIINFNLVTKNRNNLLLSLYM